MPLSYFLELETKVKSRREQRKARRAYKRLNRRHRKALIKISRNIAEWDYSYLHNLVMTHISFLYQYYTEGNNVWQSDETLMPIIKQLKYILDLDKEIEKVVDDDLGVKYVEEDGKLIAVFPDDFLNRMNENEEKEQQLYEELYSSIGKNLQWWWD